MYSKHIRSFAQTSHCWGSNYTNSSVNRPKLPIMTPNWTKSHSKLFEYRSSVSDNGQKSRKKIQSPKKTLKFNESISASHTEIKREREEISSLLLSNSVCLHLIMSPIWHFKSLKRQTNVCVFDPCGGCTLSKSEERGVKEKGHKSFKRMVNKLEAQLGRTGFVYICHFEWMHPAEAKDCQGGKVWKNKPRKAS